MNRTQIPLFLAPAFAEATTTSSFSIRTRAFSTSTCLEARHRNPRSGNRDSNKWRGVSAMRSTGWRQRLGVEQHYPELPRPRTEAERRKSADDALPISEDHGLLGFFHKGRNDETVSTVLAPDLEESHGRAWTYHELVFKSFEDLHAIYWQCVLEINRIGSRHLEMSSLRLGYGEQENQERARAVKRTMFTIRKVLLARQQAYDEAQLLVQQEGLLELDEKLDKMRFDQPKETSAEHQSQSETTH
ncbi:54S ribosomal protein L4 mitochondrial [Lithohypha guttulata]|nr:54S ribosomal protein L4 mitochondrial [Lithohypha guttulata]